MAHLIDFLLTRREVFRVGGCVLSGYWFLPLLEPSNVRARRSTKPRGSARIVIFRDARRRAVARGCVGLEGREVDAA